MTLQPYSPERLDALALEVLDVASSLRNMSNIMREHEIDTLNLNHRKSLEWLANLTEWTHKITAELQRELLHQQATRRAEAVATHRPQAAKRGSKPTQKQ